MVFTSLCHKQHYVVKSEKERRLPFSQLVPE